MRKKHRHIMIWITPLLVLLLIAAIIQAKVNPVTRELAQASVKDVASNVINDAINRQITSDDIQYSDLITLEKDDSGNVTALTTNMQVMNQFKTQLLKELETDIDQVGDEISIPLGNLTGLQMLSGRGPLIPIKIVGVADSGAEFSGEFTDAGINQTMHRVMLTVSLDLLILLPSGTVKTQVSSDVCVAETVLLGRVPESYTYFYSTDSSDAKKYIVSDEG